MNKTILIGRLTADPELRSTGNGVEYCNFTIAIDRRTSGENKVTDFIPCKAWRATAVFVDKYFSKGRRIAIEGSFQIDKYDKDGETRSFAYCNVNSVEFCDSKSESSAIGGDPLQNFQSNLNQQSAIDSLNTVIDPGDDCPF